MQVHWIWLTIRKYIGIRGCVSLISKFGSAEQIYEMSAEEYRAEGLNSQKVIASLSDKSLDSAYELMELCRRKGIKILTYGDEIYPTRLKNIPDPPMVLYYKGEFPQVDSEAGIGVIGTRDCSLYGLYNAKEFGKSIACGGGMVVSGGARGIDTMALKGALEGQTPVICVLGSGIDVIYPPENEPLFHEITKHGCVISEFRPGTGPLGSNFPVRNRLISGLSLGIVVVEAPENSGAMITASQALEQGRDVFAIPGNIGIASCQGSNRLLREGAFMAECGWDVLSEYQHLFPGKIFDPKKAENMKKLLASRYSNTLPIYSPVYENPFRQKKIDNKSEKTYSDVKPKEVKMSADEKLVLDCLSTELIHADNIAANTGLPAGRVAAAITTLQIKKLVSRESGNYVKRN